MLRISHWSGRRRMVRPNPCRMSANRDGRWPMLPYFTPYHLEHRTEYQGTATWMLVESLMGRSADPTASKRPILQHGSPQPMTSAVETTLHRTEQHSTTLTRIKHAAGKILPSAAFQCEQTTHAAALYVKGAAHSLTSAFAYLDGICRYGAVQLWDLAQPEGLGSSAPHNLPG